MNHKLDPVLRNLSKPNSRAVSWIALISFAAGSLATAGLMHLTQVRADSDRVFQLMVYHTLPGKAPALESVFRGASTKMAEHGLSVVGFWVPDDNSGWKDTFVYLLAHPNREEAKKNWQALHDDPAFRTYVDEAKELIDKDGKRFKVDEPYMRATDFSTTK